mmetsp:Transcript_22232/g.62334  ORF Transcript_22232/g.62334 Transcript_22232/m.62334 type:complete len:327 (+) Transcript_22232:67-1047(+)
MRAPITWPPQLFRRPSTTRPGHRAAAVPETPSRIAFPFCKNWKTSVATSTLSGFLSGCHFRSSALHSDIRASLDSTVRNLMSSSNASLFAFSTSGLPCLAVAAGGAVTPPIRQSLLFESLLAERLRLEDELEDLFRFFLPFLLFLLSFFFFSLELLLPALASLSLELAAGLLLDLEALLPRPAALAKASRTALEPACGEIFLLGGTKGSGGAEEPAEDPRGVRHLKQSNRLTKFRSPHFMQPQSRVLSSSSPGRLGRPPFGPIIGKGIAHPPFGMPLLDHAESLSSPTGRMFIAVSFPSGKRCSSKVTCWPGMSRVCNIGLSCSRV